jgi:lauroyl/myristoyl acyltransferase
MKFLFYIWINEIKEIIKLFLIIIKGKIPVVRIYQYLFRASTIVLFLSNSFATRIKIIAYFINRYKYRIFLHTFFFNDANFVRLTNWIYPTFYSLKPVKQALKKGNGLLILNVHSFHHFALQILLQKKNTEIYTIIMDDKADIYLHQTKANTHNTFLLFNDKNLFFKLRTALKNNNIVIIHQDLINMGERQIEVDFMGQKIKILENIAAYLSYYTFCEVLFSYTYSLLGVFVKTYFSPFKKIDKDKNGIKQFILSFHQNSAKYIEHFVKKYPSQWMGWQYLKNDRLIIEPTNELFFPDFIFFDRQINRLILCKLLPLQIIKLNPSRSNTNLFLYFFQLVINEVKNYYKKS